MRHDERHWMETVAIVAYLYSHEYEYLLVRQDRSIDGLDPQVDLVSDVS